MEDEAILLKIKRDFTTNEAVQSLLKIVSALEIEVGILKSELAEAQDLARRIREEKTQTKKQWLQEEVFEFVAKEMQCLNKKHQEVCKSREDWRSKYFSLLAQK